VTDVTDVSDETPTYRQARFTPPAGAARLLLVRHGETEPAIRGQRFQLLDGQGDPALAPEGRAQAEAVCRRLAAEGVDAIYVTPLRRTPESAAPLARALGLTPTVEPDLREVFLGEWEGGLLREKVATHDPLVVQAHAEQRWDVIPGAEPAAAFAGRVHRGIARIAAAHPDQRVAVFSHGATIGEVLRQAASARALAFAGADNASISEVVVTRTGWVVRRYNDTAHLEA
jgi:probable phosphoglycerate mutase